ncbi:MAG TPA: protein kinase [Gemmatimonadaceae bacterium]|nr:protein kinase [Gemmatimonadaceae bacterium]
MTDILSEQLQASLGAGVVIQRELGGGGMSRVFLADELALNRRVVVKVLAPELAAGVNADRFRREILLAAGLQHPHVVPILAAGEVADAPGPGANVLPYFTMPFVQGDSLRTRLTTTGRQPIADVIAILRDVAKGLAYAHAHGIVHRDIKPENVLLSGGSAAVTDFGVAKALSSAHRSGAGDALTVIGMSLGTPAYMAPEQAAGDPTTDHRADLYSLGLVAYEMLAGRTPFGARAPQAIIAAHLVERPEPVDRLRRDAPAALATLVMRCLEKDPARRPQTAEEFLASLDAAPAIAASRRMRRAVGAIALVAVAATAWMWYRTTGTRAAGADATAIAVLPLVNTTGDPRDEYFSDGMTDELVSALSRVPGLRLASRTSTFAFKGRRDVDVREIGRRLGVGSVLEGTVRRDGPRLRLAAQLTNAADGLSLWSDSYEREVRDVFDVQDEIARAIAGALAPRLVAPDSALLPATTAGAAAHRRTTDLAAYDHYLRGRFFWHQRGEPALRSAESHFEQAIALDSTFAAAHAGLADVLALLPVYGTTPGDSAYPRARAAAERAIALDGTSAEAHTTLGLVHKSLGEWEDAERVLTRALELDPGSAAAHQWRAEVLVITGRLREAAAAARHAHQLDPFSAIVAAELGYMLTLAGEPDAGIEMGRRAITLAPDLWAGHAFLGSSFLFAGRIAESVAPLERAVQLDPNVSLFRGVLAYAYARSGRIDDARRLGEALEHEAERGGASSPVSIVYIGLGDTTRALDWLERAARQRDPYLLQMSITPAWFDPLRGEARFAAVAVSLGLDPRIMARPTGR